MNAQIKKFGLQRLVLILVITVLMIGGISVTQAAAKIAIPGDALYSLKTTLEQTHLNLAQDAGDRAELKMGFAEQRLEEIAKLIEEGRYSEVAKAVLAFEADIHSALIEVNTIAKSDPTRASELALGITSALTRYAQVLGVMAASAPESVQAEITRALDTTELASGLELPSSQLFEDDNSNEGNENEGNENEANENDDNGNDDNGNANINDDNGNDDNENEANENDDNGNDDNGNANINDDNGNDDNGNTNINDENSNDDNGNTNINDDNGNDDNGNTNINDDNGNDDNGNANMNDDNGNDDNGGNENEEHDGFYAPIYYYRIDVG